MLDNLVRLTGASDRYEAVCLTGMFGAPVLLIAIAAIKLGLQYF